MFNNIIIPLAIIASYKKICVKYRKNNTSFESENRVYKLSNVTFDLLSNTSQVNYVQIIYIQQRLLLKSFNKYQIIQQK